MNNEELVRIKGGSSKISTTVINTIIKVINTALELGKTVGSAIRRKREGKSCTI